MAEQRKAYQEFEGSFRIYVWTVDAAEKCQGIDDILEADELSNLFEIASLHGFNEHKTGTLPFGIDQIYP